MLISAQNLTRKKNSEVEKSPQGREVIVVGREKSLFRSKIRRLPAVVGQEVFYANFSVSEEGDSARNPNMRLVFRFRPS